MSEKVLLIDGHSILNRAFYAIPLLTNSEGQYTNAVYGFLNIILKVLEEEQSTHVAVAFDVSQPTFRHEQYKEYKGTRKGMPSELRQQVPLIKEVLSSMGIKIFEKPGFEADDVIGTIAKKCEEQGAYVAVLSGDRDLLQLATEKIKIRIPKSKGGKTEIEDYFEQDVLNKYEVTPQEYIDVKGLMGDPSDNIPGVPGIGEKTAVKIISKFKTIENAYANYQEIKPNKASEKIRDNYEQAILSKQLATIVTSVDVDFNKEDIKLGNYFNETSYTLFKKLEFKTLLSRFEANVDNNKTDDCSELKFEIINDVENFTKLKKQLKDSKKISMCIIADNNIIGVSYCIDDKINCFVHVCENINKNDLLNLCQEVLNNENKIIVVVHRLKEQLLFLAKKGCDIKHNVSFDTELAAYLCNPLKDTYEYDELANDYLKIAVPSAEELLGKNKNNRLTTAPIETIIKYACYKSHVISQAYEVLNEKLIEEKMDNLYYEIEMPLVSVLLEMEINGIKVDADALCKYGEKLTERIVVLEKEIYFLSEGEFNINSPKQLGEVLFEKLSLPVIKKTKTGYSTAQEVLDKLMDKHPIIHMIMEYRQLVKLKSTYVDGLTNVINKEDGRIHSKFNQTITATGRISSTEPNLQNIPIKLELGREIRKVFIPEKDYVYLDADYSQIELRLLAHLSQDDNLINAYKNNQDIHRLTASQVFHIPFDEVSSLQRSNAKAVNFGIVYGISAFSLSQDLNISKKEAEKYIDNYFEKYPSVKIYLDNCIRLAKQRGYAVTMFNRKRPIPEINSSNFMQRSFGERVAMNSPIQGSAADIIKIAMIRVYKQLKKLNLKSKLILQVHDELLIETHNDEIDVVKELLKNEMINAAELYVPLETDVKIGNNWYETK